MKKAYSLGMVLVLLLAATLCGCSGKQSSNTDVNKADTSGMDFFFEKEDREIVEDQGTKIDVSALTEDSFRITSGGVYTLTGEKEDVMILVDAGDSDVTIILDGVTLNNSNGPAIYVRSADKVTLTVKAGTTNTLSDGTSYEMIDSESTLDAAIFSKDDLTINGTGTLIVNGNYKHGIVSKDDLIISSGTMKVTANSVGLNGKDCVKVGNGDIVINAGSDGIRSDNTEDSSRGYVYLCGGTIVITAGNDGIQAETVLNIEDVNLMVVAGGGSQGFLSAADESFKGLKAGSDIYITGGTFNIDSKDDCIHSNGTITISGGTYALASGDDGIHADTDLAVSGDTTKVTITKSYEGLEATNLVISGGNISIVASDDGLNAAGGSDTLSFGRPGMGQFSGSTGTITITGGQIYVNASGDGIDSNGDLTVSGGELYVSGPTNSGNGALDYEGEAVITGGTVIAAGAAGMALNFGDNSTQGSILVNLSGEAGSTITLKDGDGEVLVSWQPEKEYSSIVISCPDINKGETYTVSAGSNMKQITMSELIYGASEGMGGGWNHGGGNRPGGNHNKPGGGRK